MATKAEYDAAKTSFETLSGEYSKKRKEALSLPKGPDRTETLASLAAQYETKIIEAERAMKSALDSMQGKSPDDSLVEKEAPKKDAKKPDPNAGKPFYNEYETKKASGDIPSGMTYDEFVAKYKGGKPLDPVVPTLMPDILK
jgi:hypothetical protein